MRILLFDVSGSEEGLLRCLRECFKTNQMITIYGPVELKEIYIEGKERNKLESKDLMKGRGASRNTAVLVVAQQR